MANVFFDLPTFAQNGPGTAVDVSSMGALKTITVGNTGSLFQPFVTIEFACDAAGAQWTPLKTFKQGATITFEVACLWMRAVISNYKGGGAPNCDVSGDDTGTTAVDVPVPAGNATGASVDISALPNFKTVQIGGAFRGTVNVEISNDGVDFEVVTSFQAPAKSWSGAFAAQFVQVTRVGVPQVNPGLPVVSIAACEFGGGGGGGGGVDVEEDGAPLGTFTTLNFVGDGVTASDAGGGIADIDVPGNVMALPEQWVQEDIAADQVDVALSAQVSTNFDSILAIRDGSLVGLRTRITDVITSGELTITVQINGVDTVLEVTHDAGTNPDGGVATVPVGDIPYVAGDEISVIINTDAAFEPIASLALEAWVEVFEAP